jgi:hypothetical protein
MKTRDNTAITALLPLPDQAWKTIEVSRTSPNCGGICIHVGFPSRFDLHSGLLPNCLACKDCTH